MLAEKVEALPEIAGIGLQRLRRQPPFAAQMRQPARHLQRDIVGGAVELDRWNGGSWLGHMAVFAAFGRGDSRPIISHPFRLPFANLAGAAEHWPRPARGLKLAWPFGPESDSPMDHSTRASTSSASSARVVDVLVPVALNQAYSYRVPRGMELKPGDVVCVPLGPREVVAVVWAENANPDPRLHNRLKDVGEKLDVPPLREELRSLVDWVANYTLSARGMVLRMTLADGRASRARADADRACG